MKVGKEVSVTPVCQGWCSVFATNLVPLTVSILGKTKLEEKSQVEFAKEVYECYRQKQAKERGELED
ncbi:hypothetical protein LCGC14_0248450 [marine sediment metagenome]|uniref:Uncharacterized protein n=1 Tax=marine sediment metagenome TaxID=412755 RepID=A0A0F9X9L8_9ZZZZ